MMIDKHAVQALPGSRRVQMRLDRQYNERWFEDDRALPCYRCFIGATRQADDPLLPWLERHFGAAADLTAVRPEADTASPTAATPPDDAWRADSAIAATSHEDAYAAVWDLIAIHAANQTRQAQLEPERRDTHVAELDAQRIDLFTHLDAVKRENVRLAALLREVEQSATFRLVSLLRRLWPASR